jgi:hypothetical protein
VSPIYTRPIREQLEHDRVIRQLQIRYKRKHEVAINPGLERNQGVTVGEHEVFPDLVLFNAARTSKIEGTVDVETGESVHLLEARAEWGVFTKMKAPFHLYVPPQMLDTARRLCEEHQFPVAEIWTYHSAMDQVRFTQVYRSPSAVKASAAAEKAAVPKAAAPKTVAPKTVAPKAVAPKAVAPKAAAPPAKSAVAGRAKSAANGGRAAPKKAAPVKAAAKSVKAARTAKPITTAKAAKPPARSKTAPTATKRAPVKKRR